VLALLQRLAALDDAVQLVDFWDSREKGRQIEVRRQLLQLAW
jgi:hypothetical protein